jgi:hypothetical protein
MQTLLAEPALTFAGEHHDIADLVLVGLLTGRWQELERLVAAGVALDAEHPAQVASDDLKGALTRFRYERQLIAAAELEAWLAERSLRLDELQGVLRRELLRERFAATTTTANCDAVMRAEAICTGALAAYAGELRAWHAASAAAVDRGVAGTRAAADAQRVDATVTAALADAASGLPALGSDELGRRVARLAALAATYERVRDEGVSEAAIDARVAAHRLDWTLVTGRELSFALEGAARETRLRVEHDGETLQQVAGVLGVEPVRRELELGSAPKQLGSELLAAREGSLVGPWHEDGRWRVLELDGRFEPDGHGRARARDELLGELVERYAAGKAGRLAAL